MTDEPMPNVANDLAPCALSLARGFAAGATMWCASPSWPAHGRHVAVEFVHPVIVGKRALPTVHVDSGDLVGAIRLLARPGDILIAIGRADDAQIAALLRRSQAWGLTSVWLGAGARPPPGAADHVIWESRSELPTGDDGAADLAARSGELVMLYHLLWELTHVVFEHPGLLEADPACGDDTCVTCSDEGRLAEVAAVHGAARIDVVAAGRPETVDASLLDPVAPGDLVLVHAGVAISAIEETGR